MRNIKKSSIIRRMVLICWQSGKIYTSYRWRFYHQERWDGKGYPTRIKGEEIPFPARIIAIADSTDAMLSDRPYRDALTEEDCKKELKKNSGIMYEPWLVDLFLDNWNYIVDGIYGK